MAIYTRAGDGGETSLAGGIRVAKNHLRIETNGVLDEANSFIGLLRVKLPAEHSWQKRLFKIQVDIMHIMSHIARTSEMTGTSRSPKIEDGAEFCERWIDEMSKDIDDMRCFVVPGQTEIGALCHVIRTVIRRGERFLSSLMDEEPIDRWISEYINRLSDLFFVLANSAVCSSGLKLERVAPFKK